MKKNALFAALLLFFASLAGAQTIVKGSGVLYTNGAPTLVATQSADAEIAIDTTTGFWYEYNRDELAWSAAGFRIQLRDACTLPTHTPGDKQSYVVLDTCDNLYRFRAGTWTLINAGGGGGTDLAYSGTSSPITLTSSTGTDVTITQGGIVTVTASGSNMTISGTEVDGSVTNEGQLGVGAGGANTATITTNTSGGNPVTVSGGGILAVTETTGSNGGTITLTANEVDGSITNEGILGVGAGGASSSTIITNTSTGNAVTINVAGINAITESTNANGGSITITATEVDGSTTNELQTIANTSDATSHTATLSNSGGSIKLIEGANITLTTGGTGLNGEVTIAATGGSVTANNGVSDNENGGNIRLGNRYMNSPDAPFTTDRKVNVDGNRLYIGDNTDSTLLHIDGVNDRVGIGTTAPGRKLTVNGEVEIKDLTTTAATFVVGADGNGVLSEVTVGSGLDLTAGVLTATGGGGGGSTDLSYTGTDSPITLNSSTGTDVTITEGGIVDITATGTNMTISATEVDGSVTNELQTVSNTSNATSHTVTLSNSGGSVQFVEGTGITMATTGTALDGIVTLTNSAPDQTVSITGAGISVVTGTYPSFTVTSTEVDGSVTNEGTLGVGAGGASSSTITTNTSGGNAVTINVAGINTITESVNANGGSITITATEVDGVITNEGQLGVGAGGANTATITTNTSGGNAVTISGGGILAVTETTSTNGGTITLTATEVDGSVSNEGSLTVAAGAANTSIINSNTSGSTGVTITAAGINTISEAGNVITLTATEVDGSTTNELQTIANTSDATSHTATLSNTGGSIKLVEGANITLTTTGTGLDGIVTIASTGSADGNGIYSGDGTVPSLTTATVTNQFTFSRATDDVGGLVPVRISVAAGNEPDFISFVNGSDSMLISKGDQEFEIFANKTLSISSNEIISLIADSVQVQAVPTALSSEKTLLMVTPANTIVKSEGLNPNVINQDGASSGDVLTWDGSKWAPAAGGGGGGGDVNQGGNSFGAAMVIGTNDNNTLSFETNGTTRVSISTGATTGGEITQTVVSASTGNSVPAYLMGANSTGTAGDGFGPRLMFRAESSTTNNQDQSYIRSYWKTANHATREGAIAFAIGDNGGALAEVFEINRSADADGALSIGTGNSLQLDNDELTPSLNFTINGGANDLTLGGGSGTLYLGTDAHTGAVRASTSGNMEFRKNGTTTTATQGPYIFSNTSGTPAAGFGANLGFSAKSNNNAIREIGKVDAVWTTATDASRTSDMVFYTVNNTTTGEAFRVYGNKRAMVGGGTNQASAALQVNSTTGGFLKPKTTTTEMNAIATPTEGLEVYNTTEKADYKYDGTAWRISSHEAITGRSTGQTAAVASVATLTVGPTDASYTISGNINVTTSSAESFSLSVDYTDETNTARNAVIPILRSGTGAWITSTISATGAVPYPGGSIQIRAKASTAITIKTSGTFTGCTYNVEGSITRVN